MNVSVGYITTFAQKMQFPNLKQLQIYVAQEIVKNNVYKIVGGDAIENIVNDINIFNRHALDKTASSLNYDDLKHVAKFIKSAKQIFTYGIGASKLASDLLTQNLNILNKNIKSLNSMHDLILWLDLDKKDKTLMFLFSNTLKTNEILNILQMCEDYHIITIVITGNKTYPETANSLFIRFDSYESEISDGLKLYTPKISQIFIVDILTSYLSKTIKNKKRIPRKYLNDNFANKNS